MASHAGLNEGNIQGVNEGVQVNLNSAMTEGQAT